MSPGRTSKPLVLVFDVNETLSDLAPMATRFDDVGAAPHLAMRWFAGVLRDGFALTAVGSSDAFSRIAAEGLRVSLHDQPLNRSIDAAAEHIMQGFQSLPLHRDVVDGIRALDELGIRMVTLSNGSASVADGLLERAGIRQLFERLLTVEDAGVWKPSPAAYAYALNQCGVDPGEAMLVAVHPWDIDGAARAGLGTVWVSRDRGPYPGYFTEPDLRAESLIDLADQLP